MTIHTSGSQDFCGCGPFSLHPNRCGLLRCVNGIFPVSTSTTRSEYQASACHKLPSPRSNTKGQSTCKTNMPNYSLGAFKLNNHPNGRIETIGFCWL